MAPHYSTFRVRDDLLDDVRAGVDGALDEFLDAIEPVPQTILEYPTGTTFTVVQNKPVRLGVPTLTADGDVSVPVMLAWLKGVTVTEARGSVAHARVLVEALLPLLGLPEAVLGGVDAALEAALGPRVDLDGTPVADGGIDVRNPTAEAMRAAIARRRRPS